MRLQPSQQCRKSHTQDKFYELHFRRHCVDQYGFAGGRNYDVTIPRKFQGYGSRMVLDIIMDLFLHWLYKANVFHDLRHAV